MKKITIFSQIFLFTFALFSNFNSIITHPKKRSWDEFVQPKKHVKSRKKRQRQSKKASLSMKSNSEEAQNIESFFDMDDMDNLLYAISDKSIKEQFSSINRLEECCDQACPLTRSRYPQYRQFFENKILEEFEKSLLETQVKNNELFLTYTSFACGYLFQDFVILNKIIRLIESNYTQITKINLNLNLIDPITNKKSEDFDLFDLALTQLETYLTNKTIDVQINTELYSYSDEYIDKCLENNNPKSDIITCSDYESVDVDGTFETYGFNDLLLKCLKEEGQFFYLDKNGILRNTDALVSAIDNNILNASDETFNNILEDSEYLNYFNSFNSNTTDEYLKQDSSERPSLFYGTITPENGLLNTTNFINIDSGKTFRPLLIHTMIH